MKKIKKIATIFGISLSIILLTVIIPSYSSSYDIPSWVKGVANFWVEGNISDDEFGEAITFLIEQEILRVEMPNTADNSELQNEIASLEEEILQLQNDKSQLEEKILQLQEEISLLKDTEYEMIPELSLTVSVDQAYPYEDGDLVKITGKIVGIEGIAVSLQVINPDGNVIHSEQLSPRSDDSFSTSFVIGDPSFDKFGKYVVKVEYGSVEAETSFWYNPG